MTLIDFGPPAAEPVTLADLKGWCRIERTDEDALIVSLGKAAREPVEAMTRTILSRRGFRLVVDEVPADGGIELPRAPVRSVGSVTAFDAAGVPHVFGAAHVVIERVLGIEAVRVSQEVVASAASGLEIEFDAGFEAGAAPEGLKLALRRIVSASYEVRAALPAAEPPAVIPPAVEALIAPYRRIRL